MTTHNNQTATDSATRCEWCSNDPLYQAYHDHEWGVPCYDDATLFEFLILEGAQAGLSWITILKKREHFRKAYAQFDPQKMARFSDAKIEKLLQNPNIIRNRLKVEAARSNARAYLDLLEEGQTLSDYLWQFVEGKPIQNRWRSLKEIPVSTPESDQMSKSLKKKGFRFVGPTICYAFMQATGMVNDHITGCFRYEECAALS